MKLTRRGKDYLKATLVGTIAATIIDFRVVLALCFAILVAAMISEVILARSTEKSARIQYSNSHLACFKGEEAKVSIKIQSNIRRLISIHISGVLLPDGIATTINDTDPNSIAITFKPMYAGRFTGLRVKYDLNDPLLLFSKTIEVTTQDFVIDCYPQSILTEIRAPKPMSIALGERASGTHGSGLEFYSIDDYQGLMEKKNIFWKKVAAMPDERLLVKTREANIPKTIRVALIQAVERKENFLPWIDLACEGIALICKIILRIGCDVEILYGSEGEIEGRYVSDLAELSDAVMEMSASRISSLDSTSLLLSKADICVTGFNELETDLLALAVARKPSVLIQDVDSMPRIVGDQSVVFSGHEDLSILVNRVVGQ